MNLDPGRSWKLKKYGRRTESGWTTVDGSTGDIALVLQKNISVIIIQNAVLLESVPLLASVKAVGKVKADMLLIEFKNDLSNRRKFRVIFVRGEDSKNPRGPLWDCINSLRMYFPITDVSVSREPIVAPIKITTLEEILKDMFISRNNGAGRIDGFLCPSTPLLESTIDDTIRLCLLDPTFPSFVNTVDKCLKSLMSS